MVYLFLLLLIVVATLLNRRFLSIENLTNLMTTAVPYLLVSFAQTSILLVGGIDLSVGSVVSLSNAISARLMVNGPLGYLPALAVSLAAGCGCGYGNGFVITKGRLQPIIVTLASSSIIAGLALAILPAPGGTVHLGFAKSVTGLLVGIPVPLLLGMLAAVLLWITLNRTKYGRSVYATGGNEYAAYSSGILVDRIKLITFVICGLMSSIAGVYISLQMFSGDALIGSNMSLISITTAVLGGTSLAGGKGSIVGSTAGVFIFIIINNVLNLTGVPSFYQFILQGALLIIALTIGTLRLRR
jgi:ribose transport system permease protein